MLAQTPRAVTQAVRLSLALVSNSTMSAGVRDDQLLPEEFQCDRSLPVLRQPGAHPFVDYLRPVADVSFPAIERSGDSRMAAMTWKER